MRYIIIFPFLVVVLTSCVTGVRYTGDEFYYTREGVEYSCREPKPYLGGNCKGITDWEDYE